MVFTDAEREFLSTARLGRIATVSRGGDPDVAPVGFRVDEQDDFLVGGLDNAKTLKYHNVKSSGRAAMVVDELVSVDPWRVRGVKVHGSASIEDHAGRPVIRIRPERVWSWAINPGATGMEKRKVA